MSILYLPLHSVHKYLLNAYPGFSTILGSERAAKMKKATFLPISSSKLLLQLIGNRREKNAPWAEREREETARTCPSALATLVRVSQR